MNAQDILHYGHQTVLDAVADMPDDAWEVVGATSAWSIKDILSPLTAFETVLVEVLTMFLGEATSAPTLERFGSDRRFNDAEIERRRAMAPAEVLAEYSEMYERVEELASRISPEDFRRVGTIPWYGPQYALDDFIVYAIYAHKREHCGQIRVHRKRLGE